MPCNQSADDVSNVIRATNRENGHRQCLVYAVYYGSMSFPLAEETTGPPEQAREMVLSSQESSQRFAKCTTHGSVIQKSNGTEPWGTEVIGTFQQLEVTVRTDMQHHETDIGLQE